MLQRNEMKIITHKMGQYSSLCEYQLKYGNVPFIRGNDGIEKCFHTMEEADVQFRIQNPEVKDVQEQPVQVLPDSERDGSESQGSDVPDQVA